jgi:carboxymethylenebutenolidase
MGEMVEFPSNGATGGGYLARAHEGAGLGVVVIQEWWGLVDHIVDVCDRLAAEGFTALAPDLYHGRKVPNQEPDDAMKASMALDLPRAAKDMSGAVDFLRDHPAVRGDGVGVIGFCMGGGLALWLATIRPDAVRAAVPFYGIAPRDTEPDWSALAAPVEGHYAEHDDLANQEAVAAFEARLNELGKEIRVFTYPGTGHAFFNDTRPGIYNEEAARLAWVRTLEFLRAKLG